MPVLDADSKLPGFFSLAPAFPTVLFIGGEMWLSKKIPTDTITLTWIYSSSFARMGDERLGG